MYDKFDDEVVRVTASWCLSNLLDEEGIKACMFIKGYGDFYENELQAREYLVNRMTRSDLLKIIKYFCAYDNLSMYKRLLDE